MPRRDDIETAFRAAVEFKPDGRRIVTTKGFVRELQKYNWDWTLKEANKWIELSVSTFRDVSTEEGENRTFSLYNPNGGL